GDGMRLSRHGLIGIWLAFYLSLGQSGALTVFAVIQQRAETKTDFDVVVFGANPCGIAAAIAAARQGSDVALVATGKHVGGMMANGLSITDVRFLNAFGGLFKE